MRPLYETEKDLSEEQRVADILAKRWQCEFVKMPIRYHLDYVVTRQKIAIAFAELKTRNYSMQKIGEMGGYVLSIGKWASAKSLSDSSGLPFLLVVRTTDGIYYMKTKDFEPDGVWVTGRTDRKDWQDIEPCVVLSVDKFKRLDAKSIE